MANYGVIIDQTNHQVELRYPDALIGTTGGFGALYNWYAATDVKGIAAPGWHVSRGFTDCYDTMHYLDPGGTNIANSAGGLMKLTGYTYWNSPNTSATNSSSFNCKGPGFRLFNDGSFSNFKNLEYFWSPCGFDNSTNGCISTLIFNGSTFNVPQFGNSSSSLNKHGGASIRLVKDSTSLTNGQTGTYLGNDGKLYPSICIGSYEWLAQNLAETKYKDGTLIPNVTDNTEWTGLTTGAMCAYDNDWSYVNGGYLIYLLPVAPVVEDQSFQVYEGQSTGTTIGTVISTDPTNITYSIISGNTSNRFSINSSTGVLTTAAVLDYDTQPTGYTLTVQVVNNLFPYLFDTAIITITVLQIFTICATNYPSFSAVTEDNLVGYLHVGVITTSSGTVGDYAIEWRLGSTTGTTVFLSGAGSDPLLQAIHPFYDLVQAGTLYPVVRYLQINGVKYSAYPFSSYGSYSPDLKTCLPNKTVASMSCSNGTTGGTYGHIVSYINTTMPSGAANRSLTYMLNPDGSSKEIAYQFYGYAIADRIQLSYVTNSGATSTIIDDWVVGLDCTGTTYNTTPKIYQSDVLKTSVSLTGFTYLSDDYLLFTIYPSYNAGTGFTDTNWQLSIKCFTTSRRLSSAWCDLTVQQIDTGATMTFTYDSTNCQYVLTYNTASGFPEVYYSDIFNYLNTQLYYLLDWAATGNTVTSAAYTGATYNYINYNSDASYYPLDGQLNITISGTTTVHWIKYTFTNQNDYYIYKNTYTGMTAQSHWTDYTTDVNDLKHYKLHISTNKISLTSGDTYSTQYLYLCRDAVFNFDDVGKVIRVDTAPLIVPYTGVTCDKSATDILSYRYAINQIYSGWTFQSSSDTIWGTRNIFDYLYYFYYDHTSTDSYGYAYIQIPDGTVGSGFNLNQPGWRDLGGVYQFFKNYTKVHITNMSDPLNNYEVYTYLDPVTGFPSTFRLIKSVP